MANKSRRILSVLIPVVLVAGQILAAATLLAGLTFAEGTDINGKWVASMSRPDGSSRTITMNLAVSGSTLSGTITTAFGDEMAIENGKFEGSKLSFDAQGMTPNGMQITFQYSGQVEGDVISLSMQVNGHQIPLKFRRGEKK